MTLTVEDARRLVGLKSDDRSRDARLDQLISAAYEQAAAKVGALTPIRVQELVRSRAGHMLLRHVPVSSVVSVEGLTDLTGLRVHATSGFVEGLPASWSYGDRLVVYTSGHISIPASVEEGIRAWVRHRWAMESYGTSTYGDAEVGDVTDFDGLPNAVRNAWGPYLLSTSGVA